MEPRCVAGAIYRPREGFRDGWILHDGARVLDAGEGAPPVAPDATGVVLPSFVDAHTHVGDRVARGIDLRGLSLADVVKPPHGLKHRILADTPRAALVGGMRDAIGEAARAGAGVLLDFREGGVDGVRALRDAAKGANARVLAFGRAPSWSDDEIARVLAEADGIGFPGLADADGDAPERAAAACHRAGKPFALHFSEGEREDVARALALRPAFLVHAVHATAEDLDAIAAARVPIVTCPRSNALFGGALDVPAALARDIPLAIGSDNAMFHPTRALDDARLLLARWPAVGAERVLDMLVDDGRRALLGKTPKSYMRAGDAADLVVLPRRDGQAPLEAIFGMS